MYQRHFGLKEMPFSLTPNTAFFFSSDNHRDAFNTLLFAVRGGEGFIKLTGEIGMGKTLLCRKLLNSLSAPFVTAYVPNPYMEVRELLAAIAEEFGVKLTGGQGERDIIKKIEKKLISFAQKKRKPVLVIDEAQALPDEALEAIRLISNLETEKRKLVQIVLFGQPELESKLHAPQLRQLRQRIGFSFQLTPLTGQCTVNYVQHRLQQAGYKESALFTRPAMMLLFAASGGIPRLINIFSHKALLSAYGRADKRVRFKHVWRAVKDSDSGSYWTYWLHRGISG